jgi:hypothetical protein
VKEIEGYDYKLIDGYMKTINEYIVEFETLLSKSIDDTQPDNVVSPAKNLKVLMKIINKIYDYIIKNDIPINLNLYKNNLQKTIDQLKIQLEKVYKYYKLRYQLFNINNISTMKYPKEEYSVPSKEKEKITLGETNLNYVLDYVIRYYKITDIQDIEKLFTSLLMGYNKNYIFYYMILIRWLTVNNKYLYVLKDYVSILSYSSLHNFLDPDKNMDEYISFIIILINRYITHFKFDRFLEIKPYTEFEKYEMVKTVKMDTTNDVIISQYDSKNGALLYDYNIMKLQSQISFNDVIIILYNLFRTKLIYHQ